MGECRQLDLDLGHGIPERHGRHRRSAGGPHGRPRPRRRCIGHRDHRHDRLRRHGQRRHDRRDQFWRRTPAQLRLRQREYPQPGCGRLGQPHLGPADPGQEHRRVREQHPRLRDHRHPRAGRGGHHVRKFDVWWPDAHDRQRLDEQDPALRLPHPGNRPQPHHQQHQQFLRHHAVHGDQRPLGPWGIQRHHHARQQPKPRHDLQHAALADEPCQRADQPPEVHPRRRQRARPRRSHRQQQ